MCEDYETTKLRNEEGGTSYRADKSGAQAVGCTTSVSEAHAVCVQCTYMEVLLPGSVGAARKAVKVEGLQS